MLAEALGEVGTALATAPVRVMTEVIWKNCISAKVMGNKGDSGEDQNQAVKLVELVGPGGETIHEKESRGDLCCLL